jgi:hypothetical protein
MSLRRKPRSSLCYRCERIATWSARYLTGRSFSCDTHLVRLEHTQGPLFLVRP